jgi:hypothetical protein
MLLFGASFYVLPNSLLGKTKEKRFFLLFFTRLFVPLQPTSREVRHSGKNGGAPTAKQINNRSYISNKWKQT